MIRRVLFSLGFISYFSHTMCVCLVCHQGLNFAGELTWKFRISNDNISRCTTLVSQNALRAGLSPISCEGLDCACFADWKTELRYCGGPSPLERRWPRRPPKSDRQHRPRSTRSPGSSPPPSQPFQNKNHKRRVVSSDKDSNKTSSHGGGVCSLAGFWP